MTPHEALLRFRELYLSGDSRFETLWLHSESLSEACNGEETTVKRALELLDACTPKVKAKGVMESVAVAFGQWADGVEVSIRSAGTPQEVMSFSYTNKPPTGVAAVIGKAAMRAAQESHER